MSWHDPIAALLIAFAVSAALTPFAGKFATAIGAVDQPRGRGVASGGTPLLGGIAILIGVLAACLVFIAGHEQIAKILAGACVITLVGALDDRFDISPIFKLLGQIFAAWIPVAHGLAVERVTTPLTGGMDLAWASVPLTIFGVVAIMNMINLSDGVDGLAAGVCAIAAFALGVVAWDLYKAADLTMGPPDLLIADASVIAAATSGAAVGFLIHNFNPATVFMGDAGANLLGYLLGMVAIAGAAKTQTLIALVAPLCVLALPLLDTTFVIAKRLRAGAPIYEADQNHFHHRLRRVGFSDRKTVLVLYGWTISLACLAMATRFVPYRDEQRNFDATWGAVLGIIALAVLALSIYIGYLLEIVKLRRLDGARLRKLDPTTTEMEVAQDVARRLQAGDLDEITSEHHVVSKHR